MYVYMILKLDIRFFNVFILDVFTFVFYFYILYVYISIIIIIQYIITTREDLQKHVKGLSGRHIPATDIWCS